MRSPGPGIRVAATLGLLLSGCGALIPSAGGDRTLALGYVRYDPSRRMLQHISPGFDLRLGGPADGLDLGWSETTILEPPDEGHDASASTLSTRFAWRWDTPDGFQHAIGLVGVPWRLRGRPCSFVSRFIVGVGAGFSSRFAGIEAGAGRTTVVEADPHRSAAFLIQFDSRDRARCRMVRLQEDGT